MYSFDGIFSCTDKNDPGDREVHAFSNENVMLRGMTVRNTKFVTGVVLCAGADTKLFQNSSTAPSKFSRLDVVANRWILCILGLLCFICTLCTVMSIVWASNAQELPGARRYLVFIKDASLSDFHTIWITFLILFNNMIPISLHICIEMVKWYQAKTMRRDPLMVRSISFLFESMLTMCQSRWILYQSKDCSFERRILMKILARSSISLATKPER